MIQVIDTDIFVHATQAIIHQANCWCRMKSGIAAGISRFYPEAVEADKKTKEGDYSKLGTYSKAVGAKGIVIYNLYGQYYYGSDTRKTDYEAVCKGLTSIKKDAINTGIKHISLPYNLGCGLAGGDWRIVSSIIETVFEDNSVDIDICRYTPQANK